MSLVDLIVVLLYLVLIVVGKTSINAMTLTVLVVVLIVERIIVGERLRVGVRP